MKLKQFLKPDWRKIAIFVIIFLLTFLYGVLTSGPVYGCALIRCKQVNLPWRPCPICSMETSDYLNGIIYYTVFPVSLLDYTLTKPPDFIASVFLSAIQFFYWYFLSCLAIWFYDKFKNMKVKK